MINLAMFASFTGLHLAILQFGYFFVLLVNVTSTYVTYMTVVISWMAGTLAGLLWKRLSAGWLLILGVLSYYAIYFLVVSDPLSSYNLALASVGVAFTGLWAGRFFVVMLPLFKRADQLFFHENNGFLLGIIGAFLGFSLLGLSFLLWAPLLSVIVLLAHMAWLGARHRSSDLNWLSFAPVKERLQR